MTGRKGRGSTEPKGGRRPRAREHATSLLDHLFVMHYRLLLKIARENGAAGDDSDVLNATYVKLRERWELWCDLERGGVKAYMITSVRHSALDHSRRRNRAPKLLACESDEMISNRSPHDSGRVEREYPVLLDRIAELKPDERRLIQLRLEENLSFAEIAGILKIKVAAARMKVSRLRKKIRERQRKYHPDA